MENTNFCPVKEENKLEQESALNIPEVVKQEQAADKKSIVMLVVVVVILLITSVVFAYFIFMNKKESAPAITTSVPTQSLPTQTVTNITPTVVPTVSTDNSVNTIKKELNQTEVSDFSHDLEAIEADIDEL
jgi:flagellar basal body-associated protein FliL